MLAHGVATPLVVAYAPRERTRAWIKRVFGKAGRVVPSRTTAEFAALFRKELVDAALVDATAGDGFEDAAALALEYPTVAFLGLSSFRPSDGPTIARCAELDFADVLVEGVDEVIARESIVYRGYSARFAAALEHPPDALALTSPLQVAAWKSIIAQAGRPVRTSAVAAALGVTREHLSRSFGTTTPTLKRLIDLVRLLSAAELAKNPGYDSADVARLLGFSSSAHLSLTAQRLIGRRATSLAALRGVDVIERFARETTGRATANDSAARSGSGFGNRRR
jgi:AraC-like DNA-binding protein